MSITATAQFISNVVQSIAYAHIEHLSSYKYAAHKTLDEYYKDMPEHIDTLAETFLGTNGKLHTLPAPNLKGAEFSKLLPALLKEGEALCSKVPSAAIRAPMENVLTFMGHIMYKLEIK